MPQTWIRNVVILSLTVMVSNWSRLVGIHGLGFFFFALNFLGGRRPLAASEPKDSRRRHPFGDNKTALDSPSPPPPPTYTFWIFYPSFLLVTDTSQVEMKKMDDSTTGESCSVPRKCNKSISCFILILKAKYIMWFVYLDIQIILNIFIYLMDVLINNLFFFF